MAKKKGSYNPFYIPSLDALKAQSRQEAQAQVDASVAALPKTSDLQSQFDKTGREFKAMDTGYQAFLQNQQLAAPALFDTGTDVQATTATGITDPGAAQKAKQASNVLAMQGFGFANERQSAISGAAAKVNENQARNRRQLNDALLQLTQQIAAEKAKFSPLYYQTLNDKKSQALNAYQAYLGAQLNNAQLNAQVTNDQAQIDVSQQNADTAANKAASAAAARDAAGNKVLTPSQKLARSKAINKVFADADKMISVGIPGTTDTKIGVYSIRYKSGVDADGNAKFATVTVEYPLSKSVAQIEAELKAKYGGVGSSAPTAILTSTKTTTTKIKNPQTYDALYNFMYAALRRFRGGYTPAHTKKVVQDYLRKNGFYKPSNPPAGSHGPGK